MSGEKLWETATALAAAGLRVDDRDVEPEHAVKYFYEMLAALKSADKTRRANVELSKGKRSKPSESS